jgi:hypothetical protein
MILQKLMNRNLGSFKDDLKHGEGTYEYAMRQIHW